MIWKFKSLFLKTHFYRTLIYGVLFNYYSGFGVAALWPHILLIFLFARVIFQNYLSHAVWIIWEWGFVFLFFRQGILIIRWHFSLLILIFQSNKRLIIFDLKGICTSPLLTFIFRHYYSRIKLKLIVVTIDLAKICLDKKFIRNFVFQYLLFFYFDILKVLWSNLMNWLLVWLHIASTALYDFYYLGCLLGI